MNALGPRLRGDDTDWSFPRRRESKASAFADAAEECKPWVPAFAGTTPTGLGSPPPRGRHGLVIPAEAGIQGVCLRRRRRRMQALGPRLRGDDTDGSFPRRREAKASAFADAAENGSLGSPP